MKLLETFMHLLHKQELEVTNQDTSRLTLMAGDVTLAKEKVKSPLKCSLCLILNSFAMNAMDIDHGVSPGAIIKSVIMLGFNERRAHTMVLEALDQGYLIVAEKKLPPPTSPTKS